MGKVTIYDKDGELPFVRNAKSCRVFDSRGRCLKFYANIGGAELANEEEGDEKCLSLFLRPRYGRYSDKAVYEPMFWMLLGGWVIHLIQMYPILFR